MKMKYLHVVLLVVLAAFVCACQSAATDETHAAAPTATQFIASGSSASFSATPSVRITATSHAGHATSTATAPHTPTATHTVTRPPTATPIPTRKPTTTPTVARPTPTPAPKKTGVNGNPWGYDFSPGNYISSPPAAFCSYFNCISTFWNGHGYVVECQDSTYSKSGGISGSCSHHGGNLRALYAH